MNETGKNKDTDSPMVICMCGGDSSADLAKLFFQQANKCIVNNNLKFLFYSDGTLSQHTQESLAEVSNFILSFPEEREVLDTLDFSLKKHPNLNRISGIIPPIRKLLHIPLHASRFSKRYVFLDTDIIFINKTDVGPLFNLENPFIFMKDIQSFYFLTEWKRICAQIVFKHKIPLNLNSGVTAYNFINHDLDYLEYLARKYQKSIHENEWSIEQTLVMLMSARHPIVYIHPENLCIPDDNDSPEKLRQCNALHFTGNVRHRIAEILSQNAERQEPHVVLKFIQTQRLPTRSLAKHLSLGFLRRKINRLRWYLRPLKLGRLRKLFSK